MRRQTAWWGRRRQPRWLLPPRGLLLRLRLARARSLLRRGLLLLLRNHASSVPLLCRASTSLRVHRTTTPPEPASSPRGRESNSSTPAACTIVPKFRTRLGATRLMPASTESPFSWVPSPKNRDRGFSDRTRLVRACVARGGWLGMMPKGGAGSLPVSPCSSIEPI
jgi:hypothetical protein